MPYGVTFQGTVPALPCDKSTAAPAEDQPTSIFLLRALRSLALPAPYTLAHIFCTTSTSRVHMYRAGLMFRRFSGVVTISDYYRVALPRAKQMTSAAPASSRSFLHAIRDVPVFTISSSRRTTLDLIRDSFRSSILSR